MFVRGSFRGAGNIDLGPNEIAALKHRVGPDVTAALNLLKGQAMRIQSILGLQGFIKPDAISRIDSLIADWTILPGEETMPELVEPPPSTAFGPPGPRGGFGFGPPGMPGAFPPGATPEPMASDIVEQMNRDYQRVRQRFGDRTVAILVTGLPIDGNPPALDIGAAISKRIKECAPETETGGYAIIGNAFETVVAPVNDRQDLASRIDFGTVTVKNDRIEVQLDSRWAANVPRRPAPDSEPPTSRRSVASGGRQADPADPEVPPGADAVTRSLIELRSSDRGKRSRALDRLQRSTPDGRVDQVVGILVPFLDDDEGFFVTDVIKTLAVWKSPEALTGLIARTRDNRHFVRGEAIKALGKYPELRAAEAVVAVMNEDRHNAEESLKAMGTVAEPAVISVLRNPDPDMRRQACQILSQIGGQDTLKEMQSLPADPDTFTRMAAQDAWKKIVARVGPPPKPVRGKTATGSGKAATTGR
jgi:hypothetical protein